MTLNLLSQENVNTLNHLLDWDSIISPIANSVHFQLSKQKVIKPPAYLPLPSLKSLTGKLSNFYKLELENLEKSRRALKMLNESNDFETMLTDLEKDRVLDIFELNKLITYIEVNNEINKLLLDESGSTFVSKSTKSLAKLLSEFRLLITNKNETTLDSDPELRKLSRELNDIEANLRSKCQALIISDKFKSIVSYDQYDIFNDRFAIAIRSDSYSNDLGAIIGHSSSGKTLFLEPDSLKGLNNKRLIAKSKIEKFLFQLCEKFKNSLQDEISELRNIFKNIHQFDYFSGLASFFKHQAMYTAPNFDHTDDFNVSYLFHPFIEECVANSLKLKSNEKGLIITGPNTGGKTVFIKSIAICYLFYFKGFFLPCEKASLPHIDYFYFHCNDHQDLVEGLSSFSSEVQIYLKILDEIKRNNFSNPLILIDEIFNSTGSEEASALALAYLETLKEYSKNMIILSTHHEMLKISAHKDRDYLSGHFGYDLEESKPTYKLQIGEPGHSMALTIFEKYVTSPIGNAIYNLATKKLNRKKQFYEGLLAELQQKNIELDKNLSRQKTLTLELQNQKSANQGLLKLERDKIANQYKDKLNSQMQKVTSLLKEVSDKAERKALQKNVDQTSLEINLLTKPEQEIHSHQGLHGKSLNIDDIHEGDLIYSTKLNSNVNVIEVNHRKKQALVAKDKFRSWQKIQDLFVSTNNNSPKKKQSYGQTIILSDEKATTELDLRGFRLEDFINEVETHLAFLNQELIPFLNIIHGHGDGVLKSWLRKYLLSNKATYRFETQDGNDGSTRILLN